MLLCNHEKIAVQIAHGYSKASGKPMMAIVHNVVGLLHSPMGIYYAYIDGCPVFIVGATGPMDEKYRRPFIDWIHTAFAQGDVVRNFTKWDYQPGHIHGDRFLRPRLLDHDERTPRPGLHVLRLGNTGKQAERRWPSHGTRSRFLPGSHPSPQPSSRPQTC